MCTVPNENAKMRCSAFRDWLPVIILSFSAFIFNTSEFAPISLLSGIATDLNTSESNAGLLITFYAWAVALLSLPLTLMMGSIERKKLLIMTFLLFIISHVGSYYSVGFWTLLLSRIGVASAHAVFWSVTSPIAVRMAPKGKESTALSVFITGGSMATVLGLPLGRILGLHFGWRITFLSIGLVAFIILLLLIKTMPKLRGSDSGSLRSLSSIFHNKPLIAIYVVTVFIVIAHFTAYSYIEPFLVNIDNISKDMTTFIIFLFGVAGILGCIIFARYSKKYFSSMAIFSVVGVTISLFLLYPISQFILLLIFLCLFWGICNTLFNLVFQTGIMQLAPQASSVAMSIYSGIYNLGIGTGALVGGIVCSKMGISNVGFVGGGIGVMVVILHIFINVMLKKNEKKS